ncbi:hypothetical protein [Nocardia shimofusensis]|uniref:hypothetical protein n=1 Tax=Nocardia shimofusensis TaxID=228596 RepID=UPI000AF2E343|nr:hypothetical protein [Nocardia shimofusensis]
MDPVQGTKAAEDHADAVVDILERIRTELLLTIAVARMAPRAGVLAAQLIKGIQIPFLGRTYSYSPTRGMAPAVFDVCDPDGLRPGWTTSSTTVAADLLLDALTFGSEHHAWGGRMWLPTFFSRWEEDYRHQLAAVHGCKPRDLQIPFFGDLRKLRNDVAHRGGVARADGAATCEILQWFEAGDPIVLTHTHFKEVIDRFPWLELAQRPAAAAAGRGGPTCPPASMTIWNCECVRQHLPTVSRSVR